jgi:hypothetical protein
MLWVRISIRERCTLCDKVCQWLETGLWFCPSPLVSSTNKTDRHDITEIVLVIILHTDFFFFGLNLLLWFDKSDNWRKWILKIWHQIWPYKNNTQQNSPLCEWHHISLYPTQKCHWGIEVQINFVFALYTPHTNVKGFFEVQIDFFFTLNKIKSDNWRKWILKIWHQIWPYKNNTQQNSPLL